MPVINTTMLDQQGSVTMLL